MANVIPELVCCPECEHSFGVDWDHDGNFYCACGTKFNTNGWINATVDITVVRTYRVVIPVPPDSSRGRAETYADGIQTSAIHQYGSIEDAEVTYTYMIQMEKLEEK